MKRFILSISIILAVFPVAAQGGYETVLRQVEENSTRLIALRKQMEAQQLDNRTGLYLADPEVEFGYLWGNPGIIGNRTDISISQSFDFPTAYAHRGKIARLQNVSAELAYKAERLDLLLSAKRTCIELIYNNAFAKEFAVRIQNATRIADAYQTKFDLGFINILEYNKAKLNLSTLQTEAARIEAERASLLTELKGLNGGKDIDFHETSYPSSSLPASFEDWYTYIESKSPVLQYMSGQIEIGRQQVKLNRALALPRFSAGYISEKIVGEHHRGVSLGVSIPLWENKNRVRQAKAQVRAAESALEDTKVQFYNRLQALYSKATVLQKSARSARQALDIYGNEPLLKKALDAGEISLITYLLETDYYYNALDNVLESERDFELAMAELEAVAI